jgi:hypothetical protein
MLTASGHLLAVGELVELRQRLQAVPVSRVEEREALGGHERDHDREAAPEAPEPQAARKPRFE